MEKDYVDGVREVKTGQKYTTFEREAEGNIPVRSREKRKAA